MAESEGIKQIINWVAIQTASAVLMTFRDADLRPQRPLQYARES